MKNNEPTQEELEQRQRWFESYVDRLENDSVSEEHEEGRKFRCPCCNSLTLDERGGFDICPVCFWEDDGQDDHDADVVRGGPNKGLSLTEARKNFRDFGACDRDAIAHVRPVKEEEK